MLYGLIIGGAVLSAIMTWSNGLTIHRAHFALYLGLILLISLVLPMLPVSDSALAVVTLWWAGIAGFLVWLISSARSRDAYGAVYLAIAMFVPIAFVIAVLFLLFKPSKALEQDEWGEDVPTHSWLNNGLAVTLGICALGIVGLGAATIAAINSLGSELDTTFDAAAQSER